MEFEPNTFIAGAPYGEMDTRAGILQKIKLSRAGQAEAAKQAKDLPANSQERKRLYRVVQDFEAEASTLRALLDTSFVPQHSPDQLIGPRALFASPLFRVCAKKVSREELVKLDICAPDGTVLMAYRGPELRQADGKVFMALLNLARDIQVGKDVTFGPDEFCRTVFGRYDGPTRHRLMEHVKRLQQGLLEFERHSVQLCQRFDYPSEGRWTVAVDKGIVAMFNKSRATWLDFTIRKELPEGLTTWLYSFIQSQVRLIPMQIATLRQMCGSDATERSFVDNLRRALKDLERARILDDAWTLKKGELRWRKLA
jgi:hypothetical protein